MQNRQERVEDRFARGQFRDFLLGNEPKLTARRLLQLSSLVDGEDITRTMRGRRGVEGFSHCYRLTQN